MNKHNLVSISFIDIVSKIVVKVFRLNNPKNVTELKTKLRCSFSREYNVSYFSQFVRLRVVVIYKVLYQ